MIVVLLLLTPTAVSLLSLAHPDASIGLIMENPLEEEREEERSGGEEDLKELKEYTLPAEQTRNGAATNNLAIRHPYTHKWYSSVLSVLDWPPEFLG